MIEKEFKVKHYIALGLLFIAIIISGIQPLEFEAYLLHQAGTVFMVILLFYYFQKNWTRFLKFYFLSTVFINPYYWCSLSLLLRSIQ